MNNQVHTQIVSFIWSIADDCLRDVYVRGKYRDVILPMTVIRRLDAMLEGTIENVRNTKKLLDEAKVDNQWPALCNAAGQPFCNASPFLLKDLTSRASKQKLKTDFETYLDGFSPNVQEILEKFKFRNQIATMVDADILGSVIEKFVSSDINLSPNPVYKDDEKTILKHPGLDNHGMGTIFEELIRKFNEENNEEAGEHWTPRDVVELMADLIFIPIADQIKHWRSPQSSTNISCRDWKLLHAIRSRKSDRIRSYKILCKTEKIKKHLPIIISPEKELSTFHNSAAFIYSGVLSGPFTGLVDKYSEKPEKLIVF